MQATVFTRAVAVGLSLLCLSYENVLTLKELQPDHDAIYRAIERTASENDMPIVDISGFAKDRLALSFQGDGCVYHLVSLNPADSEETGFRTAFQGASRYYFQSEGQHFASADYSSSVVSLISAKLSSMLGQNHRVAALIGIAETGSCKSGFPAVTSFDAP
ncbi:hypothetical protein [Mongoliimonas terrestris]|uniref:hypothetical protein n=1 Tax=Mongoliimonas terrestris TaxID=1709001 RepID=UPI000949A8AD|nr:hypothetical protein [Mongoliimonas terrestris]